MWESSVSRSCSQRRRHYHTHVRNVGRILRYLASRHIFEEIKPDIFRNNRISEILCTGKPAQELLKDPDSRWDGTNGIAALLSLK